MHIHGPIAFANDVNCVFAPAEDIKNNMDVVLAFIEKFDIKVNKIEEIKWLDDCISKMW